MGAAACTHIHVNKRGGNDLCLYPSNRTSEQPDFGLQTNSYSLVMTGLVQGKALDGTVLPISGQAPEGMSVAPIDQTLAERAKPTRLSSKASIPRPGHILTGRQEHCA